MANVNKYYKCYNITETITEELQLYNVLLLWLAVAHCECVKNEVASLNTIFKKCISLVQTNYGKCAQYTLGKDRGAISYKG